MEKKLNVLDYFTNKHLNYDDLLKNYNNSLIEISKSEKEYSELTMDYNYLGKKYNDSLIEISKSEKKYSELTMKYDELLKNYNDLKVYFAISESNKDWCNKYHNLIDNIKKNNNDIKDIINKQLNIIDEINDKINDKIYLMLMNNLKEIFDKLKIQLM